MSEHIGLKIEDGVAFIAINRPAKKNALTMEMYDGLVAAFEQAETQDDVSVLLLHGAEGVFTAGNDLMDFMQNPPDGEDSAVFRFLLTLARAEKPLIVAVDGPAVGIGTTLLLHADLVYATDKARFHMPFVNLGLVPEGASSYLLPRLAGYAKANELLLFGEPFGSEVAKEIGLINDICPRDELMTYAAGRAKKLAQRPIGALKATKNLMRDGTREPVLSAIKREGAIFMERLTSQEAMEAFQAFFAKK